MCIRDSRDRVAEPRDEGSPGGLRARPAALARQQRDRRPVIGNDGMQHADRDDGEKQQGLMVHVAEQVRAGARESLARCAN